jgi:hypothetical protein
MLGDRHLFGSFLRHTFRLTIMALHLPVKTNDILLGYTQRMNPKMPGERNTLIAQGFSGNLAEELIAVWWCFTPRGKGLLA